MNDYFNDSPIETADDDRYGMLPFASSIAKSILNLPSPRGTVIALNGEWGVGKSSVVNLIRRELEKSKCSRLVTTDFKCWWYRGEEALALAFLQNLNSVLSETLKDKVKGLIPKLGRGLLQAGPAIGSAAALATGNPVFGVIGTTTSFAKRYFPDEETLERTFHKLAQALETDGRRFLIIIDDIDRLSPDEALAIFRLVKSVGHLPNVMYLLVFDRKLADDAVAERYPTEGPHFLEKIIQAGFEMPVPLQADLNAATLASIENTCELSFDDDDETLRIMNIFYDVVSPYLSTPRHITRFRNAISVTWPAIANDVNVADFLALESIRMYEPKLFHLIRDNKSILCGLNQQGDPAHGDDTKFDLFISEIDNKRHQLIKTALQRLFPRLESTGYGNDFLASWDADRRVCVESHFDTYFRLSLSEGILSSSDIDDFVDQAGDTDYVQQVIRKAVERKQRDNRTMVPVYLDALNTYADRISREKVEPLLSAIFSIHDEIDVEADNSSGFGMVGTSLRCHWLVNRLTEHFTPEERRDMFSRILPNASLGWLIAFVSRARSQHLGVKDGSRREEDCLTTKVALSDLTELALSRIRESASDGTLLKHQDLVSILYRWRDLCDGDASEPLAWTNSLIENGEALIVFAKRLTSESWSQGLGMFGLGDRVAMRSARAQVDEETDIFDLARLRTGLENIVHDVTVDEASIEIASSFLTAWDRQKSTGE